MKKTLLTIALCAGLLASGSFEASAQRPGRGEREKQPTERTNNSHGRNNRHNGAAQSSPAIRPNNNSNHNNKKEKPNRPSGNKDNNSYTRPGRQPQAQPDHRPVTPGRPNRPVAPGKPVGPVRPAPVRPVRPVAPVRPMRPVYRPGRPVYQPWIRPIRPAAWRPVRVIPVIRPLFGLNFGMGLSVSINLLNNYGYNIHGYSDDVVYLNNVNELNYIWPEGMVFYENGGLARTQLYYSTPNYDTRRYGEVYSTLYTQYGTPVRTTLPGGGVQATWFSNDGGYVQLEFSSRPTYGGTNQFFTTLTFGN